MKNLNSLFSLENKTAVITGAAGGLGSQFALTLTEAGAKVYLLDKNEEGLEALKQKLQKLGREASTLLVDLNQPEALKIALDKLFSYQTPIDILINNAGMNGFAPIANTHFNQALANFDEIINVDLRANWLLTHAIAKHMIDQKVAGSIINIASISGDRAPGLNVIYSSVKAAITQLTRSLALELAPHQIRVNAILPGVFNTPLVSQQIANSKVVDKIPLGFIAEPKELNAMILLLASNQASAYMTGSLFTVDGGISISPQWQK